MTILAAELTADTGAEGVGFVAGSFGTLDPDTVGVITVTRIVELGGNLDLFATGLGDEVPTLRITDSELGDITLQQYQAEVIGAGQFRWNLSALGLTGLLVDAGVYNVQASFDDPAALSTLIHVAETPDGVGFALHSSQLEDQVGVLPSIFRQVELEVTAPIWIVVNPFVANYVVDIIEEFYDA